MEILSLTVQRLTYDLHDFDAKAVQTEEEEDEGSRELETRAKRSETKGGKKEGRNMRN